MTQPYPRPGSRGYPSVAHDDFRVTIVSDDSVSIAQITLDEGATIAATGVAKRHPKDKRHRELGRCLALSRAFQAYADRYAAEAERLADPGPAPDDELVKAMRRANRAEAVKRKNERRREARNRWINERGVEYVNASLGTQYTDADEWRGRAFGDWGTTHGR